MTTERDIIVDAKELFQQAQDIESENRQNWLDDTRFSRLGEQWPEQIKRQRELDGRPCLTFNRMPTFIRQVVNDARQNKPSIKIYPVGDTADQQTAEILQGLIRNIEVASMADVAYDTSIEHAVSGGFGYIRIGVDYAPGDTFDRHITIDRVANPLTVYGDPYSMSADSADWNSAFITELYAEDEFERRWKGAEKSSWEDDGSQRDDDWFGEDRIRVAEYWERDEVESEILLLPNQQVIRAKDYEAQAAYFKAMGLTPVQSRTIRDYRVIQRIITGAEVLEENEWQGKYIPIIPVYGDEVIVEGKRYFHSLIRHARGAQESYNYWRTSSVEKVALDTKAPFIAPEGSIDGDMENWMTSNTVNHPVLFYRGGTPPQRAPHGGVPAADMQLALQASDDIKSIIGIYDASLGNRSNETSGRAIMARQREGDTSTFHFIDNLSRAIRHCGRILVDLIPHVYDQPRIVRILAEDGSASNVPINQQVPGVERIYDLTTGQYDVTVQTGPSFNTKRQEAATQMSDMVRAFPPLMQIAGDLLVKNLDWPGADDLAKRLQMTIPQAQGQDPQTQQMQQQFGQAMGQAQQQIQQLSQQVQELTKQNQALKADTAIKVQETQIKAQELRIKEFEAMTDRMKSLQPSAPTITPPM
jgi:hypothetical protein